MNYEINMYNDFKSYTNQIKTFPILTEGEEYILSDNYINNGCIESVHKLVTSHLRFVVAIAYKYKSFGFQISDLVQEGNVGLMIAAKKFKSSFKVRFCQYSKYWILSYIKKFILDNWSLVKIGTTDAKKKLFYSLNTTKRKIYNLTGEENVELIAKELDVSTLEVEEALLRKNEIVYDHSYQDSDDSVISVLHDESSYTENTFIERETQINLHNKFKMFTKTLNERDKYILDHRMLVEDKEDKDTMEEIAKKFGVSKERVRQLEERLFKNLRNFMVNEYETIRN